MSKKQFNVEVEISQVSIRKTVVPIEAKNMTYAKALAEGSVEEFPDSHEFTSAGKIVTVLKSRIVK